MIFPRFVGHQNFEVIFFRETKASVTFAFIWHLLPIEGCIWLRNWDLMRVLFGVTRTRNWNIWHGIWREEWGLHWKWRGEWWVENSRKRKMKSAVGEIRKMKGRGKLIDNRAPWNPKCQSWNQCWKNAHFASFWSSATFLDSLESSQRTLLSGLMRVISWPYHTGICTDIAGSTRSWAQRKRSARTRGDISTLIYNRVICL